MYIYTHEYCNARDGAQYHLIVQSNFIPLFVCSNSVGDIETQYAKNSIYNISYRNIST